MSFFGQKFTFTSGPRNALQTRNAGRMLVSLKILGEDIFMILEWVLSWFSRGVSWLSQKSCVAIQPWSVTMTKKSLFTVKHCDLREGSGVMRLNFPDESNYNEAGHRMVPWRKLFTKKNWNIYSGNTTGITFFSSEKLHNFNLSHNHDLEFALVRQWTLRWSARELLDLLMLSERDE